MTDEEWWPSIDPAEHLAAMLRTVDWHDLRNGGSLHPELAARISTAAQWVVAGATENPLQYGVGDNLADLVVLDVTREVLLWVQDPTNNGLIDGVHAAYRACARFGDLLDDPES